MVGLTGKASVYNYASNDVDGNFGTSKTATGIDIDSNEFTCAVPMDKSKTPFGVGDVLLVKNGNNSVLVLATDVGGMPHADIDLVEGVTTKSLGMESQYNSKGKLVGLSNSGEVSVTKVGNIDFKNKQTVREVQDEIKLINKGEANVGVLVNNFRSKEAGLNTDQRLASLAPTIPQQAPFRSQGDYAPYNPDATRREQQDLMGWLQNGVQQEDQGFLMMLMLIIGFITGQPAEDLMRMMNGGQELDADSYGGNAIAASGNGGRARSQNEYNSNYNIQGKPSNLGETSATPEAVAKVMSGEMQVVYQEIKGNGRVSYGNMVFKDGSGNLQCVGVVTGGAGLGSIPGSANGTGNPDPRYPDAQTIPEYTIANFRNRGDKLGPSSFDVLSNGKDYVAGTGEKENRGAFRVHEDVGGPGVSAGCFCPIAKQGQSTAGAYAELEQALRSKGSSMKLSILPSTDLSNELNTVGRERASKKEPQVASGAGLIQNLPDKPRPDIDPKELIQNAPDTVRKDPVDKDKLIQNLKENASNEKPADSDKLAALTEEYNKRKADSNAEKDGYPPKDIGGKQAAQDRQVTV